MAKVIRVKGPGYERLQNLLADGGNMVGKVGWVESAKYPDGTPVAYVAAIQEYGSPQNGIPPRPFMRPTIAEKQVEWSNVARVGARNILQNGATMSDALELIGLKASGDIRRTISNITSPALAMATLAARARRNASGQASSKPLVDTGHMLQTLTNSVEPK